MLAIIIPFFKLTFFEATLQSLASQTDKRFKVYIGDDASPEDCSTLLKNFERKIDYAYHRFETNLGSTSLTQQWELCIALSQEEEWLMILGDDDYLSENVVQDFYSNYHLFKDNSSVVRYATKLVSESNNSISAVYSHPKWESAANSYFRKLQKISRSSLSEHIFNRKVFSKYGFYNYPLAWNSDDRAWIDFSDGKLIYTINESIVYVRISDYSITGKNSYDLKKNNSQVMFYRYLIVSKFNDFNKMQQYTIMKAYVHEIHKFRNLKINDYLFLLFYSIKFYNKLYFTTFFKLLNKRLKKILNS